jgi:hypothetical protein
VYDVIALGDGALSPDLVVVCQHFLRLRYPVVDAQAANHPRKGGRVEVALELLPVLVRLESQETVKVSLGRV